MTNSKFDNSEDSKLETLALATSRRTGSTQAAALRDTTGRTYVAINLATPSFTIDAIEAVFTVAMASQIHGIEAVVVVGDGKFNIQPLREFAPKCLIWAINQSGEIVAL